MTKRAFNTLAYINDVLTNSDIDFINFGHSSHDGFLWQREIINEYKIFVTYLGFIDAQIINLKNEIKFNKDIPWKKEELLEYRKQIEDLKIKRQQLVKDIINDTHINKFPFTVKNMNDILNSIPSMEKFNYLYEDLKCNKYSGNLQLEFINNYNAGFMQLGFVDSKLFEETYKKYSEELKEYRINNKAKIARAKLLKK